MGLLRHDILGYLLVSYRTTEHATGTDHRPLHDGVLVVFPEVGAVLLYTPHSTRHERFAP